MPIFYGIAFLAITSPPYLYLTPLTTPAATLVPTELGLLQPTPVLYFMMLGAHNRLLTNRSPDRSGSCLILIRQPPEQSGCRLILIWQVPDQSGSHLISGSLISASA